MTTQSQPTRRQLDYKTFEEAQADIDRLAAGAYHRCGRWDLPMMCDHISKTIEPFVEGTDIKVPLMIRMIAPIVGPLALKSVLKKRKLMSGVKAPPFLVPEPNCEQNQALTRVKALLERARTFEGPMRKHPLFGHMTLEQWKQVTLIHAAHHFSFLVPASSDSESAK